MIDKTVASGNKIHFDLTYMENIPGVINGSFKPNATTSKELQYIYNNWNKFKNTVKFYNNGVEVTKPW